MALISQKIALKPNSEQVKSFHRHVDFARVAYNAAHSEDRGADGWKSVYDIKKSFNAQKRDIFPEFADCSQNAGKNAIHAFEDARQRYKKGQNNRPKRKTHKSKPSFQIDNGVGSVRLTEDRLHVILPKIGTVRMREKPKGLSVFRMIGVSGKLVTFRLPRSENRLPLCRIGEIRRAVVSRTAGKWFISILLDVDVSEPTPISHLPVAGCDVGITHLATMDDGTVFENPRALRVNARKLRRLNRHLARKKFLDQVVGFNLQVKTYYLIVSTNWQKAKVLLSRLHARIANVRSNAHHQATHRILQGISALGIESLTVKGLMKNRKLSKALADAALSGFLVKLKYKAVRRGIRIVVADKFFPSTKRCSSCGHKKPKMSLSERTYHCGVCGFIADRDVNAAINL